MGLPDYNPGSLWLERGYITIIRQMWHILPYSQLLELLEMTEELRFAFSQLRAMFLQDQNASLLDMAYAEFTLKCYVGYADRIYATLLRKGAPLTRAFDAIGVDQPRDQLIMLLDTFYLHLHAQPTALS